jgi:hypothetical protein
MNLQGKVPIQLRVLCLLVYNKKNCIKLQVQMVCKSVKLGVKRKEHQRMQTFAKRRFRNVHASKYCLGDRITIEIGMDMLGVWEINKERQCTNVGF